jgi:hypothetical protein
MKQPVQIGSLDFATKKSAIEHFKAILHRQVLGAAIGGIDATELLWLLERHPEYALKAGAGIDLCWKAAGVSRPEMFSPGAS